MEMTEPARDIEELVADFAELNGTELAQMKELWRARNSSFIHEARPKDVIPTFYAQTLFSCALSHFVADSSLSWRLGGLYVLYILYCTQPPESVFKIYLSFGELEAFLSLLKEIKVKRLAVTFKVVQKMFAENMFLFGSVSANQKRISDTIDRIATQAKCRVQQARSRLLTHVPMCQHLEAHLVQELGLRELTRLTEDYEAAKQHALTDSATVLDKGAGPTLGPDLLRDAETWDLRKGEILALVHQTSSKALATVEVNREDSAHRKRDDSEHQKSRVTITEYEKDLKRRKMATDYERELEEELDRALEDE